jgi:hypothetical protein
MNEELERQMRSRSDDQLYEMLYIHREDWTPEALEVADQEWKSRNLDAGKLKEVQAIAVETEREKAAIADEPLSLPQKVTFFLFNYAFCLGVVQIVTADVVFKSRGYDRKFRDCLWWMLYGWLFYTFVGLLFYGIGLLCSGPSVGK